MNNNSWYYFEHVVRQKESEIDYYFIAKKTKGNVEKVSGLDPEIRKKIVWRNSLRHQRLYLKADMYFVTLSYKDVLPDIYKGKNVNVRHTVYLQHGNTAIKKLDYARDAYSNSMFKFVTYGPGEGDLIINQNNFSSHQVIQGYAHPRHKQLVSLVDDIKKEGASKRQILWFMTWREYINDGSISQEVFSRKIRDVISDPKLLAYLDAHDISIKLVLHQFFDKNVYDMSNIKSDRISVFHADETDLMYDIAASELLITDYSSIGFDFTFLGKSVVLYQFDSLMYATRREFYCDLETDLGDLKVDTPSELVDFITSGKWPINNFFRDRLPPKIDFAKVRSGAHIDELNDYFVKAQKEKISIIGYNFFGRGGTVTATLALAEGLAEAGYMLDLVSLKRIRSSKVFPGGVILKSFMNPWRSFTESLKYHFFKYDINKTNLKYDCNKNLLIPYVDFALKRYLSKTKSRTVISTREPLHLYLDEASNDYVKNKLFFFHTSAKTMESVFPDLMDVLAERRIKKALFVTENSRKDLKETYGYENYDKSVVTGNALSSSDTISVDEIKGREPGDSEQKYTGVVLNRVSSERKEDLGRIVEFGKYLKNKGISNIQIDVFGVGDYVYEFCDMIKAGGVTDIIKYKGLTQEPGLEIQSRDFLVDFTETHTFGMIYLEAVLNGSHCFAMPNVGSKEVLKGIPNATYKNWDQLNTFIQNIGKEDDIKVLVSNYKKINTRYSRSKVADAVVSLLD